MITLKEAGRGKCYVYASEEVCLGEIYQEIDGFYYWQAQANGGCYAAHNLRHIADKLGELNKAWNDQVRQDLKPDSLEPPF
jgi:hypothetical protein